MNKTFKMMTLKDWLNLTYSVILFALIFGFIGLLGLLIFEFKFDIKSILHNEEAIRNLLKIFLMTFAVSFLILEAIAIITALSFPSVKFQTNVIKYKSHTISYTQFNKIKVIIYKAPIGIRCPSPIITLLQDNLEVEQIYCYALTQGMKNILKELKSLDKIIEISFYDLLKSKTFNASLEDVLQSKIHFFR